MLKFERTVDLKTSINNTLIWDYAPLSLTINPSALNVSKKIYKIDYIFDDETKTQKLFYKSSTTDILPIPLEIGDPRNYKINKTFYITSTASSQTYGVSVYVYQIGVTTPTKIKFTLNLNAPTMDGDFGFFDRLQLLQARMFGVNNDILYVFESVNPNYYIPVIVNWNNKPVYKPVIDLSYKSKRAYSSLQPFQNKNFENPHNIDFVDIQKEADSDPNYPNC